MQDKERIREKFREDMRSKHIKDKQIDDAFSDNSEKVLDKKA